jgi:2,4-dienoyl-CoA reductase-like NADH-dependent reductase (Old Yellow Enzyme family)
MQSKLFEPVQFRDLKIRNRVFVSPMCQYSSDDGLPTDWHMVHLGSRAVGGAGLVMVEATGVSREGRISPFDSGIWSDAHTTAFARITKFIKDHGAAPAVQLAHAGRKASTDAPWRGGKLVAPDQGGWEPVAPSAIAFSDQYAKPREMTDSDIDRTIFDFAAAAKRALAAGFEVVEVHGAHGYLLHEFLSPLSNQRTDSFGGSLENRMRFPLQVVSEVREVWPSHLPVFVRISATDWAEGGWDLPQSVAFAKACKAFGVDLIDCSSGGLTPSQKIPLGPMYQTPFAEAIRRDVQIATGAVGLITTAAEAEEIVASGKADVVLLARAMLRDPYWPLHAAKELGADVKWPEQYERAKG